MCSVYEDKDFFFDADNVQLVCPRCKKSWDYGYIVCEPPTTLALRYLVLADLEKMFSFNLMGISLIRLSQICEQYALSKTKDEYKSLEFLKPLLKPLIENEVQFERKKLKITGI
ncbi:MAG: hypothetical protein RSE24_03100 [Oscillospiraceae bacterium]